MKIPPGDQEADGPNLTPVIDVVFLLLIFFLVATRFDEEEREAAPTLPQIAEAQPLTMPPKEIVVNINPDKKYVVRGKELTEADLGSLLKQAKLSNPHQSVLIRGDREVPWEMGVKVMGLCIAAGIDKYPVAVTRSVE